MRFLIMICVSIICFCLVSCQSTERELQAIIKNCSKRPASKQEMAVLLRNKKDAIAMIIKEQRLNPSQNPDLFFSLYLICLESKSFLPDGCVEVFPFLSKTIPWYISLLDDNIFKKERIKGEIWPEHPEEYLIVCGQNAIPFLEDAIKTNKSYSKKAKEILTIIKKIQSDKLSFSQALSEI